MTGTGAALGIFQAIVVSGPDADSFVQGQQTADVRKLSREHAIFGACCTGQGRVVEVVSLLRAWGGILALFPSTSAEAAFARLRGRKLGSKVNFEVPALALSALSDAQVAALAPGLGEQPGAYVEVGSTLVLRGFCRDGRSLAIAARGNDAGSVDTREADQRWRRADVAAGWPQVYAATQGAFIPAQLNLDVLGAVAEDKGCYIGQEVVARARRSGVASRMFRYHAACVAPAPGTPVLSAGSEVGKLVDAVPSDGGCELLAVIELEALDGALQLANEASTPLLAAPLPYDVPRARR